MPTPTLTELGVLFRALGSVVSLLTVAGVIAGAIVGVDTEADNQAAIDFYRRLGMQARGHFADLGLPQAAATADSLCFAKALA